MGAPGPRVVDRGPVRHRVGRLRPGRLPSLRHAARSPHATASPTSSARSFSPRPPSASTQRRSGPVPCLGGAPERRWRRLLAPEPRRIDWWAAAVQFVGTLLVQPQHLPGRSSPTPSRRRSTTTCGGPTSSGRSASWWPAAWPGSRSATAPGPGAPARSRGGSRPSTWPARWLSASRPPRSYVEPDGSLRSLALTNLGTFVGALCFLAGGLLLLPERTAASAGTPRVDRRGGAGGALTGVIRWSAPPSAPRLGRSALAEKARASRRWPGGTWGRSAKGAMATRSKAVPTATRGPAGGGPLDPRLLRYARATRRFLVLSVALGALTAAPGRRPGLAAAVAVSGAVTAPPRAGPAPVGR